jgi:hypothetical protein
VLPNAMVGRAFEELGVENQTILAAQRESVTIFITCRLDYSKPNSSRRRSWTATCNAGDN